MWKGPEAYKCTISLLGAVQAASEAGAGAEECRIFEDTRPFIHPFLKEEDFATWTKAVEKGITKDVSNNLNNNTFICDIHFVHCLHTKVYVPTTKQSPCTNVSPLLQ
jgi:bifunctional DNase/RNase